MLHVEPRLTLTLTPTLLTLLTLLLLLLLLLPLLTIIIITIMILNTNNNHKDHVLHVEPRDHDRHIYKWTLIVELIIFLEMHLFMAIAMVT